MNYPISLVLDCENKSQFKFIIFIKFFLIIYHKSFPSRRIRKLFKDAICRFSSYTYRRTPPTQSPTSIRFSNISTTTQGPEVALRIQQMDSGNLFLYCLLTRIYRINRMEHVNPLDYGYFGESVRE